MTRLRLLRWALIFTLGIGTGILIGQTRPPVARVPHPGDPMPEAYPVRVINVLPDPWYQRNAVFIVTGLVGLVSWLAKVKVLDPLRAEMRFEATGIRHELAAEAAARREGLLMITASFDRTLLRVEGTVGALDRAVTSLGPAVLAVSKIATDQAVATSEVAALGKRVDRVERLSHGIRESGK